MGKVFAVGVGPGASDHLTEDVKKIILGSDVILGYKYTLNTISNLIQNKQVHEITMENQEGVYQKISKELDGRTLVVPFTGDVNFSESEVVDRLIEIFGNVEIVSGIILFPPKFAQDHQIPHLQIARKARCGATLGHPPRTGPARPFQPPNRLLRQSSLI